MTTLKLIGKETAKARLIVWHGQRIARGFPLMCQAEQKDRLIEVTGNYYKTTSSAKIAKEYDDVFTPTQSSWTASDQATMDSMMGLIQQNTVTACAALMG